MVLDGQASSAEALVCPLSVVSALMTARVEPSWAPVEPSWLRNHRVHCLEPTKGFPRASTKRHKISGCLSALGLTAWHNMQGRWLYEATEATAPHARSCLRGNTRWLLTMQSHLGSCLEPSRLHGARDVKPRSASEHTCGGGIRCRAIWNTAFCRAGCTPQAEGPSKSCISVSTWWWHSM